LWPAKLFLLQSPSARGGPRVSVTVHTEASPEEELVNLPFTAPILVPDHTEPLIWEGKARQGLKLIARAYRGNKARGGAVKGTTAGKTAALLPGSKKASETLRLTHERDDNDDNDDEDDDDDDEDDDDDGVAALLRRTNSVLNRKAGQVVATKPVEKATAAASTVASAPAAAGLKIKQAGFLDSCSPAKETGELVAMKTGTGVRTATTERFTSMLNSVADPEWLSRIVIFIHPGSRFPNGSNNSTKRGGEKNFVPS
jgi:hypothetical protein